MATTTTIAIKAIPRRMLSEREAAEYCGLPAKRFRALCSVAPVRLSDRVLAFDMHDLDRWIESRKAGGMDEDEAILGQLG